MYRRTLLASAAAFPIASLASHVSRAAKIALGIEVPTFVGVGNAYTKSFSFGPNIGGATHGRVVQASLSSFEEAARMATSQIINVSIHGGTQLPTPPSFSFGPTVSGSTVQGQTLNVSFGKNGFPNPTAAFQWKSAGTNVGTNSSSYTTVAGDVGNTITCTVTLTNGVGSPAVATSPAVGPITSSGVAPSFTVSPTITGSTTEGNILTVGYTAAGSPVPTVSFVWKSGIVTVGTNASTYTTVMADVGNTITCQVTLTNGVGSPAVQTSPAFGPIVSSGATQRITGLTLSQNSIVVGNPSGTVIGAINVILNTGSFSGSITVSDANFQITGSNPNYSVATNGTPGTGTYTPTFTVMDSGATNSPWTSPPITITIASSATNTATITMPANPVIPTGTYVFSTSGGSMQTVISMGNFADQLATMMGFSPRWTSMPVTLVKRSDFPHFRVYFVNEPVTGWSSVWFEYGDCVSSGGTTYPGDGTGYHNMPPNSAQPNLFAYSVTVGGQTVNVPYHPAFCKWRWISTGYANPWPFALRTPADMFNNNLLLTYNGARAFGTATPNTGMGFVYTPMTLAGIDPNWVAGGDDFRIGPVTGWQGSWLSFQASGDLQSVLAQGEAAGTVPYCWHDPNTRKLIDPVVQYPLACTNYSNMPNLFLQGPDAFAYVTLSVTGTSGTILNPGWGITDGSNRLWTWVSNQTIGGGGTLNLQVFSAQFANQGASPYVFSPPTGPFTFQQPGLTATVTGVVSGSFYPSITVNADLSHEPTLAYVPFLLTGDPYHLVSVQSWGVNYVAYFKGGYTGPPFNGQSLRIPAWGMRDLLQAEACSPTSPPAFLLPKSIFTTQRMALENGCKHFLGGQATQRPNVTFNTVADGGNVDEAPANPVGTSTEPWHEHYYLMVEGFMAKFYGSTSFWATTMLPWHVKYVQAELNGTSGWNRNEFGYYVRLCDIPPNNVYTASSLTWSAGTATVVLTTQLLYNTGSGSIIPFTVGTTFWADITGASVSGYNIEVQMTVTATSSSSTTLTFPLATNPGGSSVSATITPAWYPSWGALYASNAANGFGTPGNPWQSGPINGPWTNYYSAGYANITYAAIAACNQNGLGNAEYNFALANMPNQTPSNPVQTQWCIA